MKTLEEKVDAIISLTERNKSQITIAHNKEKKGWEILKISGYTKEKMKYVKISVGEILSKEKMNKISTDPGVDVIMAGKK